MQTSVFFFFFEPRAETTRNEQKRIEILRGPAMSLGSAWQPLREPPDLGHLINSFVLCRCPVRTFILVSNRGYTGPYLDCRAGGPRRRIERHCVHVRAQRERSPFFSNFFFPSSPQPTAWSFDYRSIRVSIDSEKCEAEVCDRVHVRQKKKRSTDSPRVSRWLRSYTHTLPHMRSTNIRMDERCSVHRDTLCYTRSTRK